MSQTTKRAKKCVVDDDGYSKTEGELGEVLHSIMEDAFSSTLQEVEGANPQNTFSYVSYEIVSALIKFQLSKIDLLCDGNANIEESEDDLIDDLRVMTNKLYVSLLKDFMRMRKIAHMSNLN